MSPKLLGLVELDEALLEQLEHGEEAHDHVEALGERGGEPAERDPPDPGQLVDQLGDGVGDAGPDRRDVNRSIRGTGLGATARMNACVQAARRDAGEQVGREPAKRSSAPDRCGQRPAGGVGQRAEHGGRVLERLALEQAGEQQVALLPQGELLVEVDVVAPGSRRRAFSSTSVAAMSRNSVATSRSRACICSISAT